MEVSNYEAFFYYIGMWIKGSEMTINCSWENRFKFLCLLSNDSKKPSLKMISFYSISVGAIGTH